jgi:RNAse (barnase) inhibitor barstar
MQLQTVRPNIVQSIRAYRVEDLMTGASDAGQHFLYANLTGLQNKQDVLDRIAESFLFPPHSGKNLDTLYDCMTDLMHKSGQQPGFVVVLEQLPDHARFDREAREQLLDVFRDAADFWAERKTPFRCFYSFAVARTQDSGNWERTADTPAPNEAKPKNAPKNAANSSFGMNMPMMSSAFDTAMWLNAA